MTDKTALIQVRASKQERLQLEEIAKARDLTMAQVIRAWIRDAHKRMEKSAA